MVINDFFIICIILFILKSYLAKGQVFEVIRHSVNNRHFTENGINWVSVTFNATIILMFLYVDI